MITIIIGKGAIFTIAVIFMIASSVLLYWAGTRDGKCDANGGTSPDGSAPGIPGVFLGIIGFILAIIMYNVG